MVAQVGGVVCCAGRVDISDDLTIFFSYRGKAREELLCTMLHWTATI